jgi:baculoviral IAP repeat-containing protein 7/8
MEGVVLKQNKIVFPRYVHVETRLHTYKIDYTSSSIIFKLDDVFAEAGFFHTGKDDETVCYYCGGGLKDWDDADDPWEAHAQFFGRCPYIIMKKGQSFVDQLRDRKNTCTPIDTTELVSKPADETNTGKECIICLSFERNMLFIPCKHCCTCTSCGLMFDYCVYCRAPIRSMTQIFLV